jgi:hypothetical protein
MAKIVRLTESDLTRIVKKVIKESEEEVISQKVEDVIDNPKVEHRIDNMLSNLSDEDLEEIQDTLSDLGIDENSDVSEVHAKLSQHSGHHSNEEMTESGEPSNPKHKVREILHSIGAGNIAAWGGVPAAIAIGSAIGMPLGFAISWGVSGLLVGIAKAMGKK